MFIIVISICIFIITYVLSDLFFLPFILYNTLFFKTDDDARTRPSKEGQIHDDVIDLKFYRTIIAGLPPLRRRKGRRDERVQYLLSY